MSLIDASNFKRNAVSNISNKHNREMIEHIFGIILNKAVKFDLNNSNHMAVLCKEFDNAREYFKDSPKFLEIINEFEKELYR